MAEQPQQPRPAERRLLRLSWSKIRSAVRRHTAPVHNRYRRGTLLLAIGVAALGQTVPCPPGPKLVWNASASAPIGLYAVSPGAALRRGDMVVAWLPSAARQLAARRRYLPPRVPLVKRVAAITGDWICAAADRVTVNGWPVARRRQADAAGRPLPAWAGCRRLGPDRVLLLMSEVPDSFDGRYFGPSKARDIIGKATLLWLR